MCIIVQMRNNCCARLTLPYASHAGQTPSQLFTRSHPARAPESLQGTLWTLSTHAPLLKTFLTHQSTFVPAAVRHR